jgi:hypothetical protein
LKQKEHDKLFGMTAMRIGFISSRQILDCLSTQMRAEKILKKHFKVGEILILRDMLNHEQYNKILSDMNIPVEEPHVTEKMPLFGEICINLGFTSPEMVLECLNIQKYEDNAGLPHRYLGEIMLEVGAITKEQLDEALKYI